MFTTKNGSKDQLEDKNSISLEYKMKVPDLSEKTSRFLTFTLHRTKKQCDQAESGWTYPQEEDNTFSFMALGCHGRLNKNSKAVVQAMKRAVHEQKDFLFVLNTGDTFYPKGVSSPDDERFISEFDDKFKFIDLPFISCLGNHDKGLRNDPENFYGMVPSISFDANLSQELGNYQVLHTYYEGKEIDLEKVAYLSRQHIDCETLKQKKIKFFMPSSFYLVKIPEYNMELYVLDSNRLARDFLFLRVNQLRLFHRDYKLSQIELVKLQKKKDQTEEEQVKIDEVIHNLSLLKKEIENLESQQIPYEEPVQLKEFVKHFHQYPDRRKIIAQHHPLYDTSRRADMHHYLTPTQCKDLKFLLELDPIIEVSYYDLLTKIFEIHLIKNFILIHSHNHALSHYVGDSFCQMNVGGGGGENLHPRLEFREIQNNPFYDKSYGFGIVTVKGTRLENDILINFNNIHHKKWRFTHRSVMPNFDFKNMPTEAKEYCYIRALILRASFKYFLDYAQQLKKQHKLVRYTNGFFGDFGSTGVERGEKIIQLLLEYKPISILHLIDAIKKLLYKSRRLAKEINDEFKNAKYCDLVLLPPPYDSKVINEIRFKSHAAYLRGQNKFIYINNLKKEFVEIKMPSANLTKLDQLLKLNVAFRTATPDELDQIEKLSGHKHAGFEVEGKKFNVEDFNEFVKIYTYIIKPYSPSPLSPSSEWEKVDRTGVSYSPSVLTPFS